MIYTPMTKKAIIFMFEKHKNQKDKSGIPYVYHPLHVAESMPDEITTTVALLHDVVEDTKTSFDDLKKAGFPDEVIEVIKIMTHNPKDDYFSYIEKIGKNKIARTVKLKDLEHNMDISRINEVTITDLERVRKYKRCYEYLTNIEKEESRNKKVK